MRPQALRTSTFSVLALGALATVVLMVKANGSVSGLLTDAGPFVLWALLPYALLALGVSRFGSRDALWVGLAGSALVVAGALGVYVDAFYLHPDAQSGLAFVFIPLLQTGAALVILVVAWLLDRRARRGSTEAV